MQIKDWIRKVIFAAISVALFADPVVSSLNNNKTYETWFYGKTKVEKIDLVIKANVSKETESIEVFVAAPDQKALTGLLAELGRNLTKRGESLGKLTLQVNLTIKDSIIQRSRLLDFCDLNGICGANVVIEDSLVQRSKIG